MGFLEMERLDIKEMTLLLGPMAGINSYLANLIMDIFAEDELFELWIDFYNRTFMIWQSSSSRPKG